MTYFSWELNFTIIAHQTKFHRVPKHMHFQAFIPYIFANQIFTNQIKIVKFAKFESLKKYTLYVVCQNPGLDLLMNELSTFESRPGNKSFVFFSNIR